MKNKILLTALLLVFALAGRAAQIVKPTVNSKTSFAIVIDSRSYTEAKQEVDAYRGAVEREGLGTYIIAGEWSSPDQIREHLVRLHSDSRSPLEGVVLVGDIPTPMLRDAQHLSSAFKMSQSRNWHQSSIPSDRFYDDFDLKFDFIKQDSLKPLFFYYSLRADSGHTLNSDIYSARIRPLEKGMGDKYEQLRKYLSKVVAAKTAERDNVIDNLTMARGHGYNSESRVAWAGEQLALKEQLPDVFSTGSFVKFMDFDSYWPMKPYWLNEVKRPDLDVMLFHHHGSNDYQFINGYKTGSDVNTSVANIKLYLRSKISSAVNKGKDREETIAYYSDQYGLPRAWCEEAFDKQKLAEDSVANEQLDILYRDLTSLAPNARFVMFDACFNGAFIEDEYMAGAYIFGEGKTIVTQANTVNTIQDKWPDQFLGLLDGGMRFGAWSRHVHFLETHLFGDPTFRFAPRRDYGFDINEAVVLRDGDARFWLKALKNPAVDLQAMALRKLFDGNYPAISSLCLQTYTSSPSMIVRMEALLLLSRLGGADFVKALQLAPMDSYELIRRYAVDMIADNGSAELIPAMATAILLDNTSKRVSSKITMIATMFDADRLKAELLARAETMSLYSREMLDRTITTLERAGKSKHEDIAIVGDSSAALKSRLSNVANFRNNPMTEAIEPLLKLIADNNTDSSLRLASAEALGWFVLSHRKDHIVGELRAIAAAGLSDHALANEVQKTINRLTAK